jgi:very-short-patch-repair endonuclease
MQLAYELSSVIDFDPNDHKVRFNGRLRDVDIAIEPLNVIVEYDGAYWHRNKQERDTTKNQQMEEAGWTVIRVREEPLESIHSNDIFIDLNTTTKEITDLVLRKIAEVTVKKIPKLKKYLASDEPWREKEALKAIRAYQAERAAKKEARKKKV